MSRKRSVEAHAGVAEGTGTAHDADAWKTIRARVEAERSGPGRPEWPSWDTMMAARAQLRNEGEPGTQERVAEVLGCSAKTVYARAKKNGGWKTRG